MTRPTLRRLTIALFAALAALVPAGLSARDLPAKPAEARTTPAANWNTVIAVTPQGTRVVGNPDAGLKLVEYVSYTCPHCAHFEIASSAQLKMSFVATGKGSIEVRHVLRDPIDLAIALLTNCVPPKRFFVFHEAFMRHQEEWVAMLEHMSEGQQARWTKGDDGSRMRAIAADLKFYDFIEPLGLQRVAADRCLSDKKLMDRLSQQTKDASALGVNATPTFALNGVVLAGTHDWTTLGPQLAARM